MIKRLLECFRYLTVATESMQEAQDRIIAKYAAGKFKRRSVASKKGWITRRLCDD